MCFHLWLGTPLTLSEVRAMLPVGFSADAAEGAPRRRLSDASRDVRTVVVLRLGACACALYLEPSSAGQSAESALRGRYFKLGIPRPDVIRALDRHRVSSSNSHTAPADARRALVGFVAEHARTAGAALFLRTCHPDGTLPPTVPTTPRSCGLADVQAAPCAWLPEDLPVRVAG